MKMAVLSTLLKRKHHFESNNRINRSLNNENILSQAQQIAYNEINILKEINCIAKGVTSSGKTEIYKKLIFESLKLNKQVLFFYLKLQ